MATYNIINGFSIETSNDKIIVHDTDSTGAKFSIDFTVEQFKPMATYMLKHKRKIDDGYAVTFGCRKATVEEFNNFKKVIKLIIK